MASGRRSKRRRAARRRLICSGSGGRARHMRGLAEKIWNVFAPNAAALRAAFSSEPEVKVWIPRRRNRYRNSLECADAGRRAGSRPRFLIYLQKRGQKEADSHGCFRIVVA